MRKKVNLIAMLLTLLYSGICYSQKEIPQYKYSTETWFNANDELLGLHSDVSHMRVFAGYSHLNLLNRNFSNKMSNKELVPSIGYSLGLEFFYKYFKVGFNYTNNAYEVEDARTELKKINSNIRHQGIDSKIDFMLPLQIKRFSFYLGGGYSYQWIELKEEESIIEKKNLGEFFWDAGFNVFITKEITFFAEYLQSVNNKSINAFSRINIGLGYTYQI